MKTKIEQASLGAAKLAQIQKSTFGYFLKETNPANGMVPDSTKENSAASIAAIGFALTAYPIGVERRYLTRAEAIKRTLTTLRFFLGERAIDRTGRHRLSGVLLPFPRHENREPCARLRVIHD